MRVSQTNRRRVISIGMVFVLLLSVLYPAACAADTAEAAFVVPNVRARAGQTVNVAVQVPDNSGMVSAMLKVSYDNTKLHLANVDNGTLFGAQTYTFGSDLDKVPYTTLWVDPTIRENITATGTIVIYTFEIPDDAEAGVVPITLDVSSVFDVDLSEVPFTVTNGAIEIMDCMPGDASGDGELDLRDVVMIVRFLAGGWDVEIDTFAADVDADGILTLKDVILLRRYLADWDVELH